MRKLVLAFFVVVLAVTGYFLMHRSKQMLTEDNSVVLRDSTNTEVRVSRCPQRIVFLNASNLEIFASVGGKAVGKATSSSYPEDIKEQIKDIPEVGMIHAPNVERIMGLKPDLIVGTNVPFHVMLRKPMEVAGVPLYINMINSYEDVLRSITLFGQFAGREAEAKAKRASIEADYQALTKNIVPESGPKTLIIFGSPDSFSMSTDKSFAGDLLKRLGGRNVAAAAGKGKDSSYLPLSMEYLTKENPEVIMLITMGDGKAVMEKLRQEMQQNPIWQELKAVQGQRIYQLPSNLFTVNPGTHIIEAMQLMQGYLQGVEHAQGK
ncbi:MAG: ABC transporter substrate-binding protein [Phascolarctobacterium sp.]